MRASTVLLLGAVIVAACSGPATAQIGTPEYLADISYRLWPVRSGWGYTGMNTAHRNRQRATTYRTLSMGRPIPAGKLLFSPTLSVINCVISMHLGRSRPKVWAV